MITLNDRLRSLDLSLFAAIPSQTSDNCKRTLLLLQDCVRSSGEYIYLEIGSHLGGTIQPHYVDPLCKLIYSIDKRPEFQPDERGRLFHYSNNTTERMLKNLSHAHPSIVETKIKTFDSNTCNVDLNEITEEPNFCFIDGEHTNQVVFSDFKFCLQVCHPNSIIAFHDSNLIFKGIKMIKKYLSNNSIQFRGYKLGGSVYAILLNEANSAFADKLKPFSVDENEYFSIARKRLWKIRLRNLYPRTYHLFLKSKRILESLLNRFT